MKNFLKYLLFLAFSVSTAQSQDYIRSGKNDLDFKANILTKNNLFVQGKVYNLFDTEKGLSNYLNDYADLNLSSNNNVLNFIRDGALAHNEAVELENLVLGVKSDALAAFKSFNKETKSNLDQGPMHIESSQLHEIKAKDFLLSLSYHRFKIGAEMAENRIADEGSVKTIINGEVDYSRFSAALLDKTLKGFIGHDYLTLAFIYNESRLEDQVNVERAYTIDFAPVIETKGRPWPELHIINTGDVDSIKSMNFNALPHNMNAYLKFTQIKGLLDWVGYKSSGPEKGLLENPGIAFLATYSNSSASFSIESPELVDIDISRFNQGIEDTLRLVKRSAYPLRERDNELLTNPLIMKKTFSYRVKFGRKVEYEVNFLLFKTLMASFDDSNNYKAGLTYFNDKIGLGAIISYDSKFHQIQFGLRF
jgi:hypothetical protein